MRYPRDKAAVVLLSLALVVVSCREPRPVEQARATPAEQTKPEVQERSPVEETPIRISSHYADEDRWLWVEKQRDGASGAWATASFDHKRNKIIIQTEDVERFAIDVSKVTVDWERLVILRLDGTNSELRRRDHNILHFARDRHNQWTVLEPPARPDE